MYALPRLGVGGQGPPDLGEVDLLPVAAQDAQQILLARVPVIEGADADAGPLSYGCDRCARVVKEHLSRRLEDGLVVVHRLRLASP